MPQALLRAPFIGTRARESIASKGPCQTLLVSTALFASTVSPGKPISCSKLPIAQKEYHGMQLLDLGDSKAFQRPSKRSEKSQLDPAAGSKS